MSESRTLWMKKLFSLIATLLVLAVALWIGRALWVD
ncbi:hypothetical protein ALQ64_01763 [Pseudomonas cannabina]|uniref:Uncharacterized protein n=1 Tax=Pseudomonas cannabina TaxID=86840 RepID=A0A0P9L4X3_PSECA|nr:hypothetical protein ALO81_01962 [Pseudomonas cannabina]RMN26873.1 hypothetical protein ALQ64_01763 [Pseudomonas cannabina]